MGKRVLCQRKYDLRKNDLRSKCQTLRILNQRARTWSYSFYIWGSGGEEGKGGRDGGRVEKN